MRRSARCLAKQARLEATIGTLEVAERPSRALSLERGPGHLRQSLAISGCLPAVGDAADRAASFWSASRLSLYSVRNNQSASYCWHQLTFSCWATMGALNQSGRGMDGCRKGCRAAIFVATSEVEDFWVAELQSCGCGGAFLPAPEIPPSDLRPDACGTLVAWFCGSRTVFVAQMRNRCHPNPSVLELTWCRVAAKASRFNGQPSSPRQEGC